MALSLTRPSRQRGRRRSFSYFATTVTIAVKLFSILVFFLLLSVPFLPNNTPCKKIPSSSSHLPLGQHHCLPGGGSSDGLTIHNVGVSAADLQDFFTEVEKQRRRRRTETEKKNNNNKKKKTKKSSPLRPFRRWLRKIRRSLTEILTTSRHDDKWSPNFISDELGFWEYDRSNWFVRFINDHVPGISAKILVDGQGSSSSSSFSPRGVIVELGEDKFPTPVNSKHNWLVLFCNIDGDMKTTESQQQQKKKIFKSRKTCDNRYSFETIKKASRMSQNLPTKYDKFYFRQMYRLTKRFGANLNATPVMGKYDYNDNNENGKTDAPPSSVAVLTPPPPFKVGYVNCKKNQNMSSFCSSIFQQEMSSTGGGLGLGDDSLSSEKYAVIVDGNIKFLNPLLQQQTKVKTGGADFGAGGSSSNNGRLLYEWVLSYILKKYMIKIRRKDDIDSKLLAHFYDNQTTPELDKPAVLLFLPNTSNSNEDGRKNKTTTQVSATPSSSSRLSTWYDELVYHFHDQFVFGIVSSNNKVRKEIGQNFFTERLTDGFQVDPHDPELLVLFPIPTETIRIVNSNLTTTGNAHTSRSSSSFSPENDSDETVVAQVKKDGAGYNGDFFVARAKSISSWTNYLAYWLMSQKKMWIEEFIMSEEWQNVMSIHSIGCLSNRQNGETIWIKFSSLLSSSSSLPSGSKNFPEPDNYDRQYHKNDTSSGTETGRGPDENDVDDFYYDLDASEDKDGNEDKQKGSDAVGDRGGTAGNDNNNNNNNGSSSKKQKDSEIRVDDFVAIYYM